MPFSIRIAPGGPVLNRHDVMGSREVGVQRDRFFQERDRVVVSVSIRSGLRERILLECRQRVCCHLRQRTAFFNLSQRLAEAGPELMRQPLNPVGEVRLSTARPHNDQLAPINRVLDAGGHGVASV